MMKALTKYLLPFCILLVNGYEYMYANTYQDLACVTPVSLQEKSAHASFDAALTLPGSVVKSEIPVFKKLERIYVEENREETNESVSVEKSADNSSYLAIACNKTIRYLHYKTKIRISICEHSSYYSSIRYLILRVIRI